VLAYNTQYYVTIENDIDVSHPANSAVSGTLGGTAFAGVTSKTAWTFTTKTTAPAAPTAANPWKVNADGVSGNFMTVQGAINAVPYGNAATNTYKVTVADGVYEELLSNYNKGGLVINGQSRAGTIIQYENYDDYLPGTGGWPGASSVTTAYTTPNGDLVTVPFGGTATMYEGGRVLYLLQASGTEMNNLTVRNTHVKSASVSNNAAECLYFSNTASGSNPAGKFISRDSNWISSQDTLQLKAYTWFYNSLIAGDVDFIWGVPLVNVFENCEIRTRVDPTSSAGGYVVNSRSTGTNPGFIFINSIFTAEAGVAAGSAYLARHNGTPATDSVVYSNCAIGPHINSTGFNGTPATGTPTAVLGLRYFGLKNPDSTPFDMTDNTSWNTSGLTTFYALSDPENTGLYGNRDKIFSGATVTYLTSSYPSIAWTLVTTY
jgi:pectin methylesterase-like acyl-CoA thioesterase